MRSIYIAGVAATLVTPSLAAADLGRIPTGSVELGRVTPAALTSPRARAIAASSNMAGAAIYGGATSSDAPFVLKLTRNGKRIDKVGFRTRLQCASGDAFSQGAYLTPQKHKVGRTGKFRLALLGTADAGNGQAMAASAGVTGRLRPGKATGTIQLHIDFVNVQDGSKVDSCDSDTERWSAKAARGRIYGGATSANEPVVVELSRNRRAITDMRIAWGAPCANGTFSAIDDLTDFPIDPSGQFGDAFPVEGDLGGGEHARIDFDVKGRIGKRKASGLLHMTVAVSAPTGETNTCDSGAISWSAVT